MMQACVIGSTGLVGGYLSSLALPVFALRQTYYDAPLEGGIFLDISDKLAVRSFINEVKPDVIFLPAAFTNVDACELDPVMCNRVNVEGVRNVAEAAQLSKAKIVFFSSDFIFDGVNGPYSENDEALPISAYGRSKLEGEMLIRQIADDFLIIRSTCIYGWESKGKNFVLGLLKNLRNNIAMNVPVDQVTNPTYAADLAKWTWGLVAKNAQGVYNITGSSLISRFAFGRLVAEVFGLDAELIKGVATSELNRPAKRPLKGGLKIGKVQEALHDVLPDARSSLTRMKEEKNDA